jgi:hypothetical protein
MAIITVPKPTGKVFRIMHVGWPSGTSDVYTAAEATAIGTDYEIIMMHYQMYGATTTDRSTAVTNIHAGAAGAGHDCVACVYVNGTYGESGDSPASGNHQPREFLYSGDPAKPYLKDSFSTWLMDPRDRGWNYQCRSTSVSVPEQMVDRRATKFDVQNADGALVDSLGWGIVGANYNHKTNADDSSPGADTAPINDQTGNLWNSASEKGVWTRYTAALAGACMSPALREGATESPPGHWSGGTPLAIYCNGVSRGTRWFDYNGPTSELARYAYLVMAENWIRDATEAANFSALQTENDWRSDANYVIDCQNRGKGAMLWTKVWGTHTHTDDRTATASNSGGDLLLTSTAHGFVNGDKVALNASTTLPGGVSSRAYFVRASTSNTFKIATANTDASILTYSSAGSGVKVRPVISQNSTDDNNNSDITRWHRLVDGTFMLATNGRSFVHFIHDYPNGDQRIPQCRWYTHINNMGWYIESFTTGIGEDVTAIPADDEFYAPGHGFAANQSVVLEGAALPSSLNRRQVYFIRPATVNTPATDYFGISTVSGGAKQAFGAGADELRVQSSDGRTGGVTYAKQTGTAASLYVRNFVNGIVIVNPTLATTNNTYTLPTGNWMDVDGSIYSGSITVGASLVAALLVKQ